MKYSRAFEVERASVDPEKGTFRATVFTGGEASDGHILSIPGGDIPDSIPLFVNHNADPTSQLGTLHLEARDDNEVVMRGEIFTEGEGAEADIRRDIVAKMAAGHVSRLSGRWDADESDILPRTRLPKDHPAFVDSDAAKRDFRFRRGALFEKWRALEGSIVGIGSDPAATMRTFSEDPEASEEIRTFWRGVSELEEEVESLASEPEPETTEEVRSEETLTFAGDVVVGIDPEVTITEAPTTDEQGRSIRTDAENEAAFLIAFNKACRDMIERGIDPEDMAREFEEAKIEAQPSEVDVLRKELTQVRQEIAELREGRVHGTADGPIDARYVTKILQDGREQMKSDLAQQARDYIALRRGARIEDEARRLAAQKIEALLEAKRR
jgi:hypothetical protein